MKKKMLLFVGLFAFLSVLALHTYADSSDFTPPSTSDFSVLDNKNNSKDDSKNSSNDTSNKKVSSNTGNSGLINPPIADNMNDYGDANSPSTVVDEAKNEEARKDLDNYTSYMYASDKVVILPSFTAGIQMVFIRSQFFVTKTIYQFVNFVNQGLNGNSILSDWRVSVFQTAQTIYGKFMSPELLPIVAMGLFLTLLYYFLHKQMMQGIRKVLLIIALSTFFVYGGNSLVTKVHDAMNDVTTSVVKTISVAGVSGTDKNDLFTTMVKIPFLYLNFDNVKIDKDGKINIKQSDIDRLLTSDDDNDSIKKIQEDLKDKHLTFKKLGDKFLTALASVFNALLLGAIYLFFSIFSFFMDFFFIILVFILPFVAIASFFPNFEKTIIQWGKTSFGVLILSGLWVFGTALIGLFDGIVSLALSSLLGSNYFFITLVKIGLYIFVYVKRKTIIGIFSAHHMGQGKFTGRMDNMLSNIKSKAMGTLKAPVLAGVTGGVTAGMLAGKFAKDKVTAGTGSFRHGWDNQRYNKTLDKLQKKGSDSEKGQKLNQREQKLREKMNKRQGKFDQSENTKRSKFREAFDKQRLRKNTEAYNNLQNKRNGKREGIKNMYDATNARAEEFLKNKPNSTNDEKSKSETLDKVGPMIKNKSKSADTIKPSINKNVINEGNKNNSSASPIIAENAGKPKVLHGKNIPEGIKKPQRKKKEPWEKDNDNPFTQKIPDNPFVIK
ncbi:hypothetical protein VN96_1672 [Lactococcus cremoris]|uniref:hypothetical protein n=1 Tax=Lactococcus lactis subsp. cremoris TaxID=1359 RepID=UPI000629FC2B|nr:hypothetical protein [Lactococcus cremoris]KKW71909.1 hypothetical protein VN96_1672 [Lactococcus cremoris]MCT0501714.1 hypothetical protein [Lactococcus cremoris]RDG21855.1 hypothetical protein DQM05_09870 [Lactococcus cremoris]